VALGPPQLQTQPMIRRLGFIVQQQGRFAAVVEGDVHVAIIIVIATGEASANVRLTEVGSGARRQVAEAAAAIVAKEVRPWAETHVGVPLLIDVARDVAMRYHDVQTAVAVDVEERSAKPELEPPRRSDTRRMGNVQELAATLIAENRFRFPAKSGHEQ